MIRHPLAAACLAVAVAHLAGHAHADAKYPERPVTIVVPSAPGGTTDFAARLVSDALARALGQPVVIDNKPGASGNIGAQAVARARPDGYTLLLAYSGYQVGNPHLFKKSGWDPIKDFAPVAMVAQAPQVLAAKSGLPAKTSQELVAYAKAHPGQLNYASSGNGSIQHIAGELFKQITGTSITHVPYKGAGPAVQDLLGGQVDLFFTTPASVVSQIKAGKLKGLLVTGPTRLSALPDVPTAAESGLKGFSLDSWFALYAPAGTPAEVVNRLHAEIAKIQQMPEVRQRAEDAGTAIESMGPVQLKEFTRSELEKWGRIIAAAGITAD